VVSIATKGLFAGVSHITESGGGGGSTLVRKEEIIKPWILVKHVESKQNKAVKENTIIVKSIKSEN